MISNEALEAAAVAAERWSQVWRAESKWFMRPVEEYRGFDSHLRLDQQRVKLPPLELG